MGRKYSMRFGVGRSKYGYWIAPVVDDYVPIVAKEYVSIIQGIANDLGLN